MGDKKLKVVNQHYISQGLLKLFSENKKSLFELNMDTEDVYRAGIASTMCDKYTYEHPFLKGNALENKFKEIEDVYIPLVKEIVESLDNNDVRVVKETVEKIMKFILLFYYRSGAILYEFGFEQDFGREQVINNLLQRIADWSYLEKLSNVIIRDYSFAIIKSENYDFLLSDQYVSTASLNCKGMIANLSNRTIGFNNCLIMIPISAKYYILYYNGDLSLQTPLSSHRINVLCEDDINAINKVILRNSYKKCVGMHQQTLEKMKIHNISVASPGGTIVKYQNGTYCSCTVKKEVFFYDEDYDLYKNYIAYCSELEDFRIKNNRKIGRNDACLCGSGKKLKKCCVRKYTQSERIFNMIKQKQSDWLSTKSNFTEKPINEFWGLEASLPTASQGMLKGLRKAMEAHGASIE